MPNKQQIQEECKNKNSGCFHKSAQNSEYCLSCQIETQQIQEKLREEFIEEWKTNIPAETILPIANQIADFWLQKLALALKEQRDSFVEMIEGKKKEENEKLLKIMPERFWKERGYNQALQDISSLIKK